MTALLNRAHQRRTHGDCRDDGLALVPEMRRRIQRRAERRDVAAIAAAELAPHPSAWLHGPLFDWSDCQHGCNGDCVIGGSGRCSFTCHDWDGR